MIDRVAVTYRFPAPPTQMTPKLNRNVVTVVDVAAVACLKAGSQVTAARVVLLHSAWTKFGRFQYVFCLSCILHMK